MSKKEVTEKKQKQEVEETKEAKQAKADAKHKEVQHGTKETKEALKLVFAFLKCIKEAKDNDGVISPSDIMILTNLFPYVGPAFEDASLIIKELKDLKDDEIKDLLVFSGAQIGSLASKEEHKNLVEKALAAAIPLVELIALIAKKK
jgi:hypothetical protein